MFRGNRPAKIDEKGRLKLPAAFKELLEAQSAAHFYITSATGKTAEIWPLSEWEKREAKLMEFGTLNPTVNKYLNATSYYGQEVEMDNQGRVLLPQILREKAVLDAEVSVLGKTTYLEVANEANLKQQLAADEVTNDDLQMLSDIVNPRKAS
jgi:MraZ protein